MKKLIAMIIKAVLDSFDFSGAISRRRAARLEEKRKKEAIDRMSEARKSVAEGDEEAVNRLLEEKRQRSSVSEGGYVERFIIFALLLFLGSIIMAAGCITRTKTIVIPADRHVTRTEMGGVDGWFVPDATMADLMESYMRAMRARVVDSVATQKGIEDDKETLDATMTNLMDAHMRAMMIRVVDSVATQKDIEDDKETLE